MKRVYKEAIFKGFSRLGSTKPTDFEVKMITNIYCRKI